VVRSRAAIPESVCRKVLSQILLAHIGFQGRGI
jgi:hypothetical protein